MTRGRYLDLLEKYLSPLPRGRVREIIADIYAHFDEGHDAGLSEEEIAQGLGEPESVAHEYLQLYASECVPASMPGDAETHNVQARIGWASEEPYHQYWKFPFDDAKQLLIELRGVNLSLRSEDINAVVAEFQGFRAPDREGNYPYIEVNSFENGVRIEEIHPTIASVGGIFGGILGGFPRLRGILTVIVPKTIGMLSSRATSGNQSIEDIAATNVSVESSSGNITAYDIAAQGPFMCKGHSGSQTLENIRSNHAEISSTSGSLSIQHIKACSLSASSHSGGIKVSDVQMEGQGHVRLSATSGNLSLRDITAAQLDVRENSGGLDGENVKLTGEASFSATSGHIRLKNVEAELLNAQGHSGKISLTNVQVRSKIAAESTSGGVRAEGISAEAMTFNSSSGSVQLSEATSRMTACRTSSGSIHAYFLCGTNVEANASSGSVMIGLPEAIGFTYDIESSSGGISIGFPTQDNGKPSRKSAHGSVRDGAHHITVRTSSGSVNIKPL